MFIVGRTAIAVVSQLCLPIGMNASTKKALFRRRNRAKIPGEESGG